MKVTNWCARWKGVFRRLLTDDDKIRLYEQYTAGEVDEEVVRLLLGNELDVMHEDAADFDEAMELDTSGMFQE